MYHLIKKDLLIQKKNLFIVCLLIIFFLATLSNIGPAGFTISVLAISYSLLLCASQIDEKNNSDIVLISLPIKKQTIVLSKYISVYVYLLFAIVMNCLVYFLVKLLQIPLKYEWLTTEGIIGAIIGSTIFASISLPLIFKWGYIKSRFPNYIIFFIFIIGSVSVVNNMDYYSKTKLMEFFIQQSKIELIGILVAITIVISIISYLISLEFYKNREY
ncbi:ABC-2 transporter permease [Calidifontibacillus erzurumensis]|uniref:ABC-2 transporter permease n=1 Tax=Calidifontibacillus erzurumensis TaxID=2741433 RepID=A0A8J8KB91_9BACI|nr:ABC-2 transporter permease [Calidifontibacillus erzurumensis]NSL50813.1 ABC-2 transporter permease [Calidifontibacillus erzurumensis]